MSDAHQLNGVSADQPEQGAQVELTCEVAGNAANRLELLPASLFVFEQPSFLDSQPELTSHDFQQVYHRWIHTPWCPASQVDGA